MMSSLSDGGFLPSDGVLSPSSTTSSAPSVGLPHPRSQPLKAGGSKESSFIRHVDHMILEIQRKFAKRHGASDDSGDSRGYQSFSEASKDIDQLVDLVWLSGTPSLQVPYLLSLALLVVNLLPGFPPAPRSTFRVLRKLDFTFASLLQGRDVDSGELLPGFATGRRVSGTDKVRIKSLIERTRVCVVEVMNAGEFDEDDQMEKDSGIGDDSMDDQEAAGTDTEGDVWDMEIARVYDRSIVELGDTLGGSPIGIVTE